MIKNLGHALRRPFANTENEEEIEEGLENCQEDSKITSPILQEYMSSQAQMITGKPKDRKGK